MSGFERFKNRRGPSEKKSKSKNRGFYAALAVCIIAVGAACVTTFGSIQEYYSPLSVDSETSNNEATNSEKQVDINVNGVKDDSSKTDETDFFKNNTSNTDSATDSENVENAENADTESEKDSEKVESKAENQVVSTTYLFPVGQTILKEYSGENPVYSKTMGDWRAHTGTDFLADKGTKVKPLTTGTVTKIYTDDLYGVTVVIDHNNGVEAYYSGLGTTVLVQEGQTVGVGDYIGSIGTIPCESLEGAHLHLSIKVNDKLTDPMELLKAE